MSNITDITFRFASANPGGNKRCGMYWFARLHGSIMWHNQPFTHIDLVQVTRLLLSLPIFLSESFSLPLPPFSSLFHEAYRLELIMVFTVVMYVTHKKTSRIIYLQMCEYRSELPQSLRFYPGAIFSIMRRGEKNNRVQFSQPKITIKIVIARQTHQDNVIESCITSVCARVLVCVCVSSIRPKLAK